MCKRFMLYESASISDAVGIHKIEGVKAHFLNWTALRTVEKHRIAREVRLSASIMANEIHRIHPVAPVCQSVIAPGAHPFDLARGPRIAYPTRRNLFKQNSLHTVMEQTLSRTLNRSQIGFPIKTEMSLGNLGKRT